MQSIYSLKCAQRVPFTWRMGIANRRMQVDVWPVTRFVGSMAVLGALEPAAAHISMQSHFGGCGHNSRPADRNLNDSIRRFITVYLHPLPNFSFGKLKHKFA